MILLHIGQNIKVLEITGLYIDMICNKTNNYVYIYTADS
jgi:hypothetical protein